MAQERHDIPLSELFHYWRTGGGDLESRIDSVPPILKLPKLVQINDNVKSVVEKSGLEIDQDFSFILSLKKVYNDLLSSSYLDLPEKNWKIFPVEWNKNWVNTLRKLQNTKYVSPILSTKDYDPKYQYQRNLTFKKLFDLLPESMIQIREQALVDIPSNLRYRIWALLLEVPTSPQELIDAYECINTDEISSTDHQLDLDIPRCHQYSELLSSKTGHEKLRRILKAWIFSEEKSVYWQGICFISFDSFNIYNNPPKKLGLDSILAPFLSLNFDDEPLAFACFKFFVKRFLDKIFKTDNSAFLKKYNT